MSLVIAVAGTSGAGKTTLTRRVAAQLNAATLFFDDYAAVSEYPPDLAAWLEGGADPDQWRTPGLVDDLRALRESGPSHIVIEEPFGRTRSPMTPLIDFVVCVDTPPEVALARRLLRDMQRSEDLERRLKEYLDFYVATGHVFYATVVRRVREAADLTLDGLLPRDELVRRVVEAVHR